MQREFRKLHCGRRRKAQFPDRLRVSGKALLQNLKMVGIGPDQIEGIIVTHEHIDHIKGVGIAARKLKVPIYTTPGIWEEIEQGPESWPRRSVKRSGAVLNVPDCRWTYLPHPMTAGKVMA